MDDRPGFAVPRPGEPVAGSVPAWDRPLVTVPVLAMMALMGGLFGSFSLTANVYVMIVGGAMTWLGLSGRLPKRVSSARLTGAWAWWIVPAAILVGVELTNFLLGSGYAHPTVSLLADPALEHYSIRSLAYFAWLGAFWGLVRR